MSLDSGNQLNQFYEKQKRARASATKAVQSMAGANFIDKVAFNADSKENSGGIATEQAVNETGLLKLAAIQDQFVLPQRIDKIFSILMQDSFIPNSNNPMMQFAMQNIKKEQIKNYLEMKKKIDEERAELRATISSEIALSKAKTKQERQMWASEAASSQGISDDKRSSMEEIANAFLMGPKDIATG